MPRGRSRRLTCTLALGASLAAHPGAMAQSQPTPPANDAAQTKPEKPNPYIERVRKREWTIRFQVTLQADRDRNLVSYANIDRFRFQTFSILAPVPGSTASSKVHPDPEKLTGQLFLDGVEIDSKPTLVGPFHSDAMYARYDAKDGDARTIRLVHSVAVTSWDTVFKEQLAAKVKWPEADWPDEAKSTFGPQQFINPLGPPEQPIADLVKAWTEGKDPHSVPPLTLAKWLAGRVQEHVQLQGDGVNRALYLTDGRGVEGLEIQPAAETALAGRGSRHDMACLLVAVYRAAGLPARLVIGIDDDPESSSREIRTWVEFALYDEPNDVLAWIPVDIAQLRARSSRMRPLDQPWEYFGANDELHEIAPLAFHFTPPVDARSFNSPALYALRMTPVLPDFATQVIAIDVTRTPQRSDDRDWTKPQP